MKAIVDEDTCVGCGLCADTCPAVFEMEEGIAKVLVSQVPGEAEDDCRDAATSCPVDSISIEG